MMGVSLCEANQGTRERVCCPSEQGPSVWLRTRACPDARSSGKLVAMIALRLSPVWTGESQKVVSPGSECGAEILIHVVPGRLNSANAELISDFPIHTSRLPSEREMQNNHRPSATKRQFRPGASRFNRRISTSSRPEPRGFQNMKQSYERYLALARAESQNGNTVAAENYYQHAEHYFRSMFSGSNES